MTICIKVLTTVVLSYLVCPGVNREVKPADSFLNLQSYIYLLDDPYLPGLLLLVEVQRLLGERVLPVQRSGAPQTLQLAAPHLPHPGRQTVPLVPHGR